MSIYELFSLIISFLTTAIVGVGLYFTYKQIRLINEQVRLTVVQATLFTEQTKLLAEQSKILLETHDDNHEWNRRALTKEVMMSFVLGHHVDELLSSLIYQDRSSAIPLNELLEIFKENPHLQTQCHTLLNYYEALAHGIKFGVYDEALVKAARRGPMRRAYVIFGEYIQLWRSRMINSWTSFEELTKKWAQEDQIGLEGRPVTGKPYNKSPN